MMQGLILSALLLASPPPSRAPAANAQEPKPLAPRVDRQIVGLVRDNFLDARQGREWAERHRDFGAGARDPQEFATLTRRLLEELRTSHTGYYTTDDVAYYALRSIFARSLELPAAETQVESIGADVTSDHFVRRVLADGPAASAGLKRGDRIEAADDRSFHPLGSFRGKADREVTLLVERTRGSSPLRVAVVPRRIDPRAEWIAAQRAGTRVVVRAGRAVAYVPMFFGGGDEPRDMLAQAIGSSLRQAEAMVLDLRDGWGGSSPEFVNLFNASVPILTMIDRAGQRQEMIGAWNKPLVVLVNGGSRSGKEVVAHALKTHRRAPLVGERTAGAVVAGQPFPLNDGSLLYLAVADVLVDQVRLERVGVEPDVPVADALPYAAGADAQLERALDLAAQAAADASRKPVQAAQGFAPRINEPARLGRRAGTMAAAGSGGSTSPGGAKCGAVGP